MKPKMYNGHFPTNLMVLGIQMDKSVKYETENEDENI
jgi:hypothetical protein